MEDSKEAPSPRLVNPGSFSRSQSEYVSSGAEALENVNAESEKNVAETHDSNGREEDVYPKLMTKVLVGIGLAFAVFLVFCPQYWSGKELIWVGRA